MRLSSLASARPVYYDRNPVTTYGTYYATVAPHGSTTRWTITNSASKKIYIDAGAISIERESAATTSGLIQIVIQSPPGLSIVSMFFNNGTYGASNNLSMGGSIYVAPGDTISANTQDNSTGGTVLYSVAAHGVQFDA